LPLGQDQLSQRGLPQSVQRTVMFDAQLDGAAKEGFALD
jgi:hypothetical protein